MRPGRNPGARPRAPRRQGRLLSMAREGPPLRAPANGAGKCPHTRNKICHGNEAAPFAHGGDGARFIHNSWRVTRDHGGAWAAGAGDFPAKPRPSRTAATERLQMCDDTKRTGSRSAPGSCRPCRRESKETNQEERRRRRRRFRSRHAKPGAPPATTPRLLANMSRKENARSGM